MFLASRISCTFCVYLLRHLHENYARIVDICVGCAVQCVQKCKADTYARRDRVAFLVAPLLQLHLLEQGNSRISDFTPAT